MSTLTLVAWVMCWFLVVGSTKLRFWPMMYLVDHSAQLTAVKALLVFLHNSSRFMISRDVIHFRKPVQRKPIMPFSCVMPSRTTVLRSLQRRALFQVQTQSERRIPVQIVPM
jgi:hypothetical protein